MKNNEPKVKKLEIKVSPFPKLEPMKSHVTKETKSPIVTDAENQSFQTVLQMLREAHDKINRLEAEQHAMMSVITCERGRHMVTASLLQDAQNRLKSARMV